MNQTVLGIRTALISVVILRKYIKEIAILTPAIILANLCVFYTSASISNFAYSIVNTLFFALIVQYLFKTWDQQPANLLSSPALSNVLPWAIVPGLLLIITQTITSLIFNDTPESQQHRFIFTTSATIIGYCMNILVVPHLIKQRSLFDSIKKATNNLKNYPIFIFTTCINAGFIIIIPILITPLFFTKNPYDARLDITNAIALSLNTVIILFISALISALINRTITTESSPIQEFKLRTLINLSLQALITVLTLTSISSTLGLLILYLIQHLLKLFSIALRPLFIESR